MGAPAKSTTPASKHGLASPDSNRDRNDRFGEDNGLDHLHVLGARVHNLKNIDVSIPRNKLTVITGISGSGKSSLAFDTIYAEGQRRYMETFSAYARQFIGEMERPDVDKIINLSPVISIEQKTTNTNPRSTVGTVTEVYDFLRLLFARIGVAYSFETGIAMVRFTEEQILQHLITRFNGKKIVLLAPLVKGRKGHYRELFEQIRKQGYLKVRVDGEIIDVEPRMQVDRYKVHDIEAVIDRIKVSEDETSRLRTSLGTTLDQGRDQVIIMEHDTGKVHHFSKRLMDPESGISYDEPSPNTFSFNSPYGACHVCKGLGTVYQVDEATFIPDPKKSINEGGIVPLGELRDNYVFRQIQSLAKKYKFSLSSPISSIPAYALDYILYGAQEKKLEVDMGFDADNGMVYELEFGGVAAMVRHAFASTGSNSIRQWAEDFMVKIACPECHGARLKKESLHFKVAGKNISELTVLDLTDLADWFSHVDERLDEKQRVIARDILKEIRNRLSFLLEVGLEYLTLDRPTRTLSGGEAQRIRLATQIGSKLRGITYILDEPTIGLHHRDNQRLIASLHDLVDMGNTVIVVEHDKEMMLAADHIVDLGPGAGEHGGEVVAEGSPSEVMSSGHVSTPLDMTKNVTSSSPIPTESGEDISRRRDGRQFSIRSPLPFRATRTDTMGEAKSLTALYLNGQHQIPTPIKRREGNGLHILLTGASGNNLRNVSVKIPLGTFTCVTGVSGSGKSSLINETLWPIMRKHFYNANTRPLPYDKIAGLEHIEKVIEVDQSPIGRTPRSNPATYTGVFNDIRKLFAEVPEARVRGYKPGRFSFNVRSGRCEECQGAGLRVIKMNFLPDVQVHCERCLGKRYNRETLDIKYHGKTISDVLDMPIEEALEFFTNVPFIKRKLQTLGDVGMGYIRLGQQSTTLSGGEAQRVKLAEELSKRDTGKTFYILDEPTTGLHFEDIRMLLEVLNRLVDHGNTVVVIEHNLDVIKVADYIVDLGPEGGSRGGEVMATGTPEQVASVAGSFTGDFLSKELML